MKKKWNKYKKFSYLIFVLFLFSIVGILKPAFSQIPKADTYWNQQTLLNALRLPAAPIGYKAKLVDLDGDNDPDLLYTITNSNLPILWIDDDDDMLWSDLEGDTDSDCLLIDKNRDGKYGFMGDLIVDWIDTDNDQKADMQVLVEYPLIKDNDPWPDGHYMWVLDTDHDHVFNYIDWNNFKIKAWDRNGLSDFYLDYSGKSAFMKTHVATYTMNDLRLNWENPFLFYDPDHDGLSELAVRMVDSPVKLETKGKDGPIAMNEKGTIDWVSLAVDLDNDNGPGNEFDYDFSINYRGKGFNYMDQVHKFENKRVVEADGFFMDVRFRKLDQLIYPDHDSALKLTYEKGNWEKVYFVFDEDDDCNRWERVEFYDPLDPFKVGTGNGGLDNNVQSDVAGDRGEWDMDNSGKGKLYVAKFDGRMHLYGAEWGAWRIDQNASLYQGWDRKFLNKETGRFATVKYLDTDSNGFFDKLLFDLDGDKIFEETVDFSSLGIKDDERLIDISNFKYRDFKRLYEHIAENMWDNAQKAIKVAEKYHLDISWYAKLMQASSLQQKYSNGYWLQFYIYRDLKAVASSKNNDPRSIDIAYYTANWKLLL